MDSITHLAIGAIIGHQTARTIPRKKAMLLGAFTQSLPDIDFLAYLWLDPANNLLAHRGFTHSILFSILTSSMLALIMDRWQTKPKTDIKYWFFFFALQAFVHLFIDVMNVYGVGLLEPFDHRRFSVNTVFVADPLFSI
ncbi:MAG: metal-dependent hydrolase, partial [Bacteroidota bacterium]